MEKIKTNALGNAFVYVRRTIYDVRFGNLASRRLAEFCGANAKRNFEGRDRGVVTKRREKADGVCLCTMYEVRFGNLAPLSLLPLKVLTLAVFSA